MRFAIVIPARNEERCLGAVLAECRRITREILVVDDGSQDHTGDIARSLGARVLRNEQTMGLGYALRRGIRAMMAEDVDGIVTLDGDGAHDASEVPAIIAGHLKSRAALTIGTRFEKASAAQTIPSAKIAANRFATTLVNLALRLRMTDVASGLRVLSRRAAALDIATDDYGVAIELLAAAKRRRLKIAQFPITVRYDACYPYCTSQSELLNLLDFVARTVGHGWPWRMAVWRLRAAVRRYEPAVVRMSSGLYYLHPIQPYRSYLFQIQPTWFEGLSDGRVGALRIGVS